MMLATSESGNDAGRQISDEPGDLASIDIIHWNNLGTLGFSQSNPLRVNRCRVGFELHQRLLLSIH